MIRKENNSHSYHLLPIEQIFHELHSAEEGLSETEAKKRLLENGRNVLAEGKRQGILFSFLAQFKSPLIYVLIIAGVLVTILGDLNDGVIIFFVLLANALIGTYQEGKANKTLQSLKDFSKGLAIVVRDGIEKEIHDEEVVVGDVIVLRSGDKVPADARIISNQSLKINEASLTGESEPIMKDPNTLKKDVPVPDRKNMVYKGSLSVSGQARAIVVEIGQNTVIGEIARKLKDIDSETPLKQKVASLSKTIGFAVLIGALFVIMIGIMRGISLTEIFFTAVAISVSLIPEGLPVVITLILARGVYRMAEKNALVKNMQAVEALGQANILAVDKTGTITKNELMVEKVWVDQKEFSVLGDGFSPKGDIMLYGKVIDPPNHKELLFAGKVACFCADAAVELLEDGGVKIIGDPTEAALLVLGEKIGFKKDELESEEPKVYEIPFSFEHKFHTTMHKLNNGTIFTSIVGAPEIVIEKVKTIWTGAGQRDFKETDKKEVLEFMKSFGERGLRVLAFAVHEGKESTIDLEKLPELCLGGLFGMKDVLREEVAESIDLASQNGVRTVMITGDYVTTAEAIAKEAHIWKEGSLVMTGAELSLLKNEELDKRIEKVSVFARVLPEHKMTIVESYKRLGLTIGMTGDGVNDALSLSVASLGIAMGKGGTEVARESADIVLLDNNFKSIVSAIYEGRSIYKTIKKVVLYLVSTSIGEFLVIAGALILGLPLPISPTQILWLNLITDGFLVVGLAFERESKEIIRGDNKILNRRDAFRGILMGFVMMLGSLLVFSHGYSVNNPAIWTLSLTVLAVFQWFNAWNCRSSTNSAFHKPFSNPYLFVGLFVTILLHLFAIYNPFMQDVLNTTPIGATDWIYIVLVASSVVWVEEIRKAFARIKNV